MENMTNVGESRPKNKVLCFICGNPGHKARFCKLNKKPNVKRIFQELYADDLASPVYDSHHRSRSPVVRSSRDDENTQSANNMSLTERDPASDVVETSAVVYVGNIPNDWEYKDIKLNILNKTKWHTPKIVKNLKIIILKGRNPTPSCKVAKVIVDDQEIAEIIVERLTNEEINGNKLEVTQDPEAPFLKDIDTNTIDIENVSKKKQYVIRNKSRQSNFHDGETRDHNFKRIENEDNLYGLSREYLSSLGITPPLQNSIFVAGFDPEKVDKEKLREVFSLAGQVGIINIFRKNDGTPKKCAIISFDHPIEAVQAISMFRNQSLYGDNLTIYLASMEKLPEGLTKLGPGLGPGGKPMRNVRTTIELEPLKHLLHKKLTRKRKADSSTNLENYVFHDAYFQQNVPTMAGSNQTIVDTMSLNSAMNTMIQNAAMTIMAQNSVMNPAALNPAMSVMTQNAAMNHMIQNATMNPMIQNTVMNSIVLNDTANPMAQNAGMNPTTQNAGMNPMTQNAGINPITQNAGMNPMIHNPSVNSMTQNAGMNPMTQNAGMNPMIHNPSVNSMAQNTVMNPMTQNSGMNPMTQYAGMNPMTQNAGMNPMTQYAGMNPMTQYAGMNPMIHNPSMNSMAQNANMTQITESAGVNQIIQNTDMNPVVQNPGTNLASRNDVSVNPIAQNHDVATNSMQNNAQQKKSCDSDSKDNGEKEKGSNILVFTNLPSSVDQRGLKSKMREIGKLVFVKLMEQGRAVVSYEQSKDALKCISIFHKCKVDGQVIEVKLL